MEDENGNVTYGGICLELLKEFSKTLNFTYVNHIVIYRILVKRYLRNNIFSSVVYRSITHRSHLKNYYFDSNRKKS